MTQDKQPSDVDFPSRSGQPLTTPLHSALNEVRDMCRDYSSRDGNVYILDVLATIDAIEQRHTTPMAERASPATDHPVRYKLHETLDEIYEVHDRQHKERAYELHCQAVQLSEQLAAEVKRLQQLNAESLAALDMYMTAVRVAPDREQLMAAIRAADNAARAALNKAGAESKGGE